jgi:hypothetical protein
MSWNLMIAPSALQCLRHVAARAGVGHDIGRRRRIDRLARMRILLRSIGRAPLGLPEACLGPKYGWRTFDASRRQIAAECPARLVPSTPLDGPSMLSRRPRAASDAARIARSRWEAIGIERANSRKRNRSALLLLIVSVRRSRAKATVEIILD